VASGRRALVTGGGRGIGRAIAVALTAVGHEVTIWGRDRSRLDAAIADGSAAKARAVDVTDADQIARAVAEDGPYAILVNSAGGAITGPFLRTDRDAMRAMLALNVESVAEVARACLPGMLDAGFGRIVTVASTAGLKAYPYVSAYVASKHAVVGLTRALALELARSGVTVNAICPGYTDTDLVTEGVRTIMEKTGRSEAEARAHFEASNPMGRLVRPEEVADAAIWLAGDGASAVTGQCIVVAGGEL
jgi:NAD(P)-dependent dehydrogenase (short-subunit alcohol dehydrogenase family)